MFCHRLEYSSLSYFSGIIVLLACLHLFVFVCLFVFRFCILNYLFVKGVQHFQAFAFSCTSSILLCTNAYFLNVLLFLMMENELTWIEYNMLL